MSYAGGAMQIQDQQSTYLTLAVLALLAPLLHPLLIPLVGVPSHLLWFIHVLAVALVTYGFGRQGAMVAISVSALMVVAGERVLGGGFFRPAPWETALSLGVSLTFANLLLAGFALWARRVTARYQLLFDGSTTGIIRTGGDGRVQSANRMALELLRCEGDALRGRDLIEVLGIPEAADIGELERLRGWTGPVTLSGRGSDGTAHLLVTALRSESGTAPGFQVLLVDRSTEVMQQQEMERTTRLATLGEALAGVAHEIKNPLTAIRGFAEIGASEPLPGSESQEIFGTIGEQAERMTNLVQELLGYSRHREENESTAIHELVTRITRVQRIALGKGATLMDRVEWKGDVAASSGKVEQIVQNLISNAVDAADGAAVVTVTVKDQGDVALIEVGDAGTGIPQDVMESIFQPFFTTKPEGKGTGLGLAISRRLAVAMGGDLEARNLEPRGAAFTLRLPKAGVARGPQPGPERAPGGTPEPAGVGPVSD